LEKLKGKVALVTGGSTGIGLATAKRFVEEGAHVFITGRRQEQLDLALRDIGRNVTVCQGDVASPSDSARLFSMIQQQKGKLDILFANAAIAEFGLLGSYTEDHFDRQFDVNVKGLVFTVQGALPLLPDGATIVLNASIVSVKGFENFGIANATKAAVRSFARTWTAELRSRGIRVNVVSPGSVETPGFSKIAGDPQTEEAMKAHMTANIPMGRMGAPDEIAKAVVFLASDDSSYVAGVSMEASSPFEGRNSLPVLSKTLSMRRLPGREAGEIHRLGRCRPHKLFSLQFDESS
jgi:NAD(P)-dependent dehydrogenase (short-subunit alcohol dehydrogenase family)